MNEQVLKSILKLLVTSVKIDGLTEGERENVENFLREYLRGPAVARYMQDFDNIVHTTYPDIQIALKICSEINKELNRKQKIIILLHLIELGFADQDYSHLEEDFARKVSEELHIEDPVFEAIKNFVTTKNIYDLASFRVLVIDNNSHPEEPHTKHFRKPGLETPIAVLRLASDEMYFLRVGRLSEELSLNGKTLNPSYVYALYNGSVIRSEKTEPIYYSTIVSYFFQSDAKPKISFEAKNINLFFKGGKQGLHNVNIAEEGGRLVALMGASGSGKSTLLNVLNGTKKPKDGNVLINGIDVYHQKEELKGVIGYVPQDDLLIEELTVYENMYYAAKLCFAKMPDEELNKLVMKTLQSLGLLETKDLKVGNVLDKTISGGQRKRVNIGLELLREPSVMFVDEPTSGLSSRDSENIMDLLKELTYEGKLIFVVIHQPSSDIFKLFDKLVVMDVGGYQIYYGNPIEAVVYFKTIADQVNSEQAACSTCGNVNSEQIFDIIDSKIIDEYGRTTDQRKFTPVEWNQYFEEKIELPTVHQIIHKPETTLDVPNRLKQWLIFSIRDILAKVSNTQYLIINLIQAPLLAMLLAYIVRYYKIDELTSKGEYIFSENLNIPAYMFMSIIVSLFMGLTISAEEIIKDAKILKREKFLRLSRNSYLFSKISILFFFSAVQSLLYTIVGNSIVGIQDMNFIYWLVLFSTSCFANMVGLNISQTFKSVITIYILIPILLIPQLILGGIVVQFDTINPEMHGQDKTPVIGDLMASRWAFESLMVSQFMYNKFEKDFYEQDQQKAYSDYKKTYYLTTLSSKLDYCISTNKNRDVTFEKNLTLIQNEIEKEMKLLPYVKCKAFDQLTPDKFSSQVAKETQEYLKNLEKVYSKMYNTAFKERDKIVAAKTKTEELNVAFLESKKRFQNERVEDFVTNDLIENRIVEYDGKLVHKIYPIFFNPDLPDHLFDFRTHFYAPYKHFMGFYVPTLYFNLAIIWLMSLALYFTLYFKFFRWLILRSEVHLD